MTAAAHFARRFALLTFGFACGAVLIYAGMFMTAGGHGTYVPFALASSPLSLIPLYFGTRQTFWLVIFLVPFWWALLMGLASSSFLLWRRLWALLIACHYAGAALLAYRTDYAWGLNGRPLRGMLHLWPVWLVGTLLLYAVGQTVMWFEALRPLPPAPGKREPATPAATPAPPSSETAAEGSAPTAQL